jgi:hypothetical protein
VKQHQKNILYTAILIIAKAVIPAPFFNGVNSSRNPDTVPAKAGNHSFRNTGFRVEPGMTNRIRLMSLCIVLIITFLLSVGIVQIEPQINPTMVYGQSKEKMGLSQDFKRDPFLLPSGIRLLSKNESIPGKSETKSIDTSPLPLRVNAILITDHIRLASIDRNIVTVGDSIYDERVLEIRNDQVVLGKGDKKRTIFLDQSSIKLTVERQGEKR